MSRYKKNFECYIKYKILGNKIQEWMEQFIITEEQIKMEEGRFLFREGEDFYQAESINSAEEANILMKDLIPSTDYFIVVFGMGNFKLLEKLVDHTSEGTRIFLLEANPYIMKYQLLHKNFKKIFKSPKVVMAGGEDEIITLLIMSCMDASWENLVQNFRVISLPYCHLYREFQVKQLKKITKTTLMEITSLGNSLPDNVDGLRNTYQNADACLMANGISEVKGIYEGMPGIVVSAGPSLDKNIQYLKEAEGKAVIITCDASYKACQRVGVVPDAIASIERGEETYNYFYKEKQFDENMVLVGPNLLWPDIMKKFPGKQILIRKTIHGYDGWWGKYFERLEPRMMGMSCANVAHTVLSEMGCDPIILIGQDLAFTDGKYHSEDSKYVQNNAPGEMGIDDYMVEDIYGNPIRTNDTFNKFRHNFEERIALEKRTVIDATEGGAKIDGTEIMTFKEAIEKYCTKEKTTMMTEHLKDITCTKEEAVQKYEEILNGVKEMLENLKKIKETLLEHYHRIEQYREFDFEHATKEELIDIVLVMQKGNALTDYIINEQSDLVTYYQQNLKQTIIYVKKIGNEVTPESVKRNLELQLNFLYLMELTTEVIYKEYESIQGFMENKIAHAEENWK